MKKPAKPKALMDQIHDLEEAVAFLKTHSAQILYASVGIHPQPVISIVGGKACVLLKKGYAGQTCGRERLDTVVMVRWQAMVLGCKVEWLEPEDQIKPFKQAVVMHVLAGERA